jgi:uncharacterized protein DUF3574
LNAVRKVFMRLRVIPFWPIPCPAFLCLALLCLAVAGCVHPGAVSSIATPTAASQSAASSAASAPHAAAPSESWVDTKLYFSLGPDGDPELGVSEAQWRDFLDREVTPRFPDGLSVIDIYGQWRGAADSTTQRERSKLLNIVYPDNAENRARIESIRAAWKKITGDQSVLKVTEPAEVSF